MTAVESRGTTVASCHADGPGPSAGASAPVIALIGAPNAGKSTLFNAITGARRTVGNWPGTTVEVGSGIWPGRHGLTTSATVLDLPGAYSLDPVSPDEALTRDLVLGPRGTRGDQGSQDRRDVPDVLLATVDAAHLARSLYLVAAVRELPLRVVVALTMTDVAARRGIRLDVDALSQALGVPVVVVDPRQRQGHLRLATVVQSSLDAPAPMPIGRAGATAPCCEPVADRPDDHDEDLTLDEELAAADARFAWIDAAVEAGAHHTGDRRVSWSDRIDAVALSPIAGPLVFLAAMWAVFQITTTVAAPLQGLLDGLFTGPVTDITQAAMDALGIGSTPVAGFVIDGLVAGVGMLLTFAPLMALMFLLLAVLEDSGYMARAAVVTDRMMRRIGLPGRAFLPLIVGFGCNVPAISATRILGHARQRVLVTLLVPFTSCSARLTVYVMLGSVFFPSNAGTIVFAMYVLSIALVLLVGLALRKTLWRTMGTDPLVLDLPPYQRPTLRLSLSVMWLRLKGFLRTAGGIIVATVAVVWLLQSVPARGAGTFGDVPVDQSAYAATAQVIAPVFEPAGFGQWESASALIVGFVAKEAVISSWAQTYAVAEPGDGEGAGELGTQITAAFQSSSDGHVTAAVLAFMVFLLAYTPCVATLAAQKREIGLRWTLVGVAIQLTVAWVLAVLVFQVGRLIS